MRRAQPWYLPNIIRVLKRSVATVVLWYKKFTDMVVIMHMSGLFANGAFVCVFSSLLFSLSLSLTESKLQSLYTTLLNYNPCNVLDFEFCRSVSRKVLVWILRCRYQFYYRHFRQVAAEMY